MHQLLDEVTCSPSMLCLYLNFSNNVNSSFLELFSVQLHVDTSVFGSRARVRSLFPPCCTVLTAVLNTTPYNSDVLSPQPSSNSKERIQERHGGWTSKGLKRRLIKRTFSPSLVLSSIVADIDVSADWCTFALVVTVDNMRSRLTC